MLNLFALIFFLYVFFRLLRPLPLRKNLRLGLTFLLLVSGTRFLMHHVFPGTLATPEAPRLLILGSSWLFIALIFLFLMTVARDLGLLALRLVRGKAKAPARAAPALLMTLAALALSAYGVGQAVKAPEVRPVTISLPGLPPALEGFKIAQISDLHLSPVFDAAYCREVAARTQAAGPDLILITGDLIDGAPEDRALDIAPLKDLRAPYGVWAIVGNHEYYSGLDSWLTTFKAVGLKVLYNENTTLNVKGAALGLAGLADPVGESERFTGRGPDLKAAVKGLEKTRPVILMSHQPKQAEPALAGLGVDLMLSGHTHGGLMPGFRNIVARFNNGFVSGLYQVGDLQLYVNPGSGLWNGMPLRLGVPSEITLLVLTGSPGPNNQSAHTRP